MDCFKEDILLDAFKEKTTYQNDYKRYCDQKKPLYRFERKRCETPEKPPPKAPFRDPETFAKWKDDVHIPFDLLLYPKPIVQTDPHKPFRELEPIETKYREEAIKTRPRIYMTPSVSMDDVPDANMRDLLCEYMYTTEWRKAEKEATINFKPKKPNIGRIETNPDVVKYQVDLSKPLESRFNQIGKDWDDKQLRGHSDPTKTFWLYKDPPVVCGACVNPLANIVPNETKREIAKLIADDKLRLPHDKYMPHYDGYKPMLPKGVPLAKVEHPVPHPALSVSQAISSRYAEDMTETHHREDKTKE